MEKSGTKTKWWVWQRNYLGKAGWEILKENSEELIEVNRLSSCSIVTTANSFTEDKTK